MPRKRVTSDEVQLDLIDVGPENAKAMKPVVRKYTAAKAERLSWLAKEVAQKEKLLELVKEAGLKPDAEGVTRFVLNGTVVTITPRDELINVKPPKENED